MVLNLIILPELDVSLVHGCLLPDAETCDAGAACFRTYHLVCVGCAGAGLAAALGLVVAVKQRRRGRQRLMVLAGHDTLAGEFM